MRKLFFYFVGVLTVTLFFVCDVFALPLNFGFETGDLSDWNVSSNGIASVVTTFEGYDSGPYLHTFSATDGTYFSLLGGGISQLTTIISQTFYINEGENISGHAAFDGISLHRYGNDSASVQIFSDDGTQGWMPWYTDLATVGNNGITSWQSWSWTAASSGTYTVNFILRNYCEGVGSSFALFDAPELNSTVNPVPEPTTGLLLCTGLLSIAGTSRKKFLRE